jgi:hypothetical protein
MKWKKRQREIKRLRAAHAGKAWRNPFPNLKEGLRPLPPMSNILDLYGEPKPPIRWKKP